MSEKPFKIPEIDMERVYINAALPVKLAELSRVNSDAAIRILQRWGALERPDEEMRSLYKLVIKELDKVY